VTGASAETVSDSGAMISSGWVSPLNVRTTAALADGEPGRIGLGLFACFLAFGFFVTCFLQQSDSSRWLQAFQKTTLDGASIGNATTHCKVVPTVMSTTGCGRNSSTLFGLRDETRRG
jgi:hypothetical protein